jgi:putative methionine-R-sulfoxide reductase with GAF domain
MPKYPPSGMSVSEVGERVRRFLSGWRAIGFVAAVAGALLLKLTKPPGWGWAGIAAGGVLLAVSYMASAWREFTKDEQVRLAQEGEADWAFRYALILGDTVTPIAHLLARIAEARGANRGHLQHQLKEKIVDAATELCGPDRTRATFFELSQNGTELRPVAWSGRADPPLTTFRAGDSSRGDAAMAFVRSHSVVYVPDTSNPPPGAGVRRDATYKSFVSVAVYGEAQDFGFLSLDSLDLEAFGDGDEDIARALAQLLAAGLAIQ